MIHPLPPPHIEKPIKLLMLHIVRDLWDSVIIGGAPPKIEERYLRMRNPRWGDMVVEVTTAYFLIHNGEAGFEDERWDGQFVVYSHEMEYGTYVCINPDGTTFNWTNAQLIAVPPFISKE